MPIFSLFNLVSVSLLLLEKQGTQCNFVTTRSKFLMRKLMVSPEDDKVLNIIFQAL